MSKKPGSSDNVAQLPTRCAAEKCNEKVTRVNFCNEHFMWFKEGLITREGTRPTDFDKKYQDFLSRKKKVA